MIDLPRFYRDQARLYWQWRATRLALLRRVVLSWVAAGAALLIIAATSANLTLDGPASLVEAAFLLAVLNLLARPLLLLALSPLPAFTVQVGELLVELVVVLVIGRFVPGVGVANMGAAIWDAVALTILNALFAEILRASDDDSYHGSQVRRLAARDFGKPRTETPGLLMVQLDGLSLPVLREQMRAGRMPGLDRQVRHGEAAIDPWYAMLPPVTPVSQAGILHGNNDDMPGFRWFEKREKTLIVANTPDGASEIERRRSNGRGLLAEDGASIGNLVTGDARRVYLTMATIEDDLPSVDDPKVRGVFVRQVNYIRLLVLTLGEVAKEWYQRERQRSRGIEPRIHRDLHYALERALTNVALRNITTALVIQEMFDEAPAIYVDYTGYDALAHHVGPERDEAVDALDGLDRTLGTLRRVARETHRPYKMVVLSDHGQSLGTPFSQLYGERLEDVAKKLIGDTTERPTLRDAWEYHGTSGMILGEIGRGPGVRSALARRASRRRMVRAGAVDDPGALVACASGNLALLYLTCSDDRVSREEIDRLYPDLIPGLVSHAGVGLVVVQSERDGVVALGRGGQHHLESGRILGDDPVAAFGPRAVDGLRRIATFSNTGDLIVIGPYDQATGEVVSYEDLVGSHGGLGGWQGEPFLLHPTDLPIGDEPLIGAPAVHAQLRVWLRSLETTSARDDERPGGSASEHSSATRLSGEMTGGDEMTDPPAAPDPPDAPSAPETPTAPGTPDLRQREPVGANAATELPAS
ncbi:MAG TPA: phage holin family protein [Candidatus Limnocylindrales bacterium]|nr:phage holin family protein [Candidatus Limnocylindrales bacterium]